MSIERRETIVTDAKDIILRGIAEAKEKGHRKYCFSGFHNAYGTIRNTDTDEDGDWFNYTYEVKAEVVPWLTSLGYDIKRFLPQTSLFACW